MGHSPRCGCSRLFLTMNHAYTSWSVSLYMSVALFLASNIMVTSSLTTASGIAPARPKCLAVCVCVCVCVCGWVGVELSLLVHALKYCASLVLVMHKQRPEHSMKRRLADRRHSIAPQHKTTFMCVSVFIGARLLLVSSACILLVSSACILLVSSTCILLISRAHIPLASLVSSLRDLIHFR